jgi:hypothetical protein
MKDLLAKLWGAISQGNIKDVSIYNTIFELNNKIDNNVVPVASTLEALYGSDDIKIMSSLKVQQKMLDVANTVSVASGKAATLNTYSGIVIFTDLWGISGTKIYTLNNNKVKTTSIITYSYKINPNAGSVSLLDCGYSVSNGQISFFSNQNDTTPLTTLTIFFRIENPE